MNPSGSQSIDQGTGSQLAQPRGEDRHDQPKHPDRRGSRPACHTRPRRRVGALRGPPQAATAGRAIRPDETVSVYQGDPAASEPVQHLRGHSELAEAFKVLDNYDATTHFNGQTTITLDGDRAAGETYCLAHHLWVENGQRTLLVTSIRYLDTFIRHDGQWLFAERQLIIDWTDKRSSTELPITRHQCQRVCQLTRADQHGASPGKHNRLVACHANLRSPSKSGRTPISGRSVTLESTGARPSHAHKIGARERLPER